MSETEAELALAGIAADIIESISMARAMELTAGLPAPPRGRRELTPGQRSLAEAANPDYAAHGVTPLAPGAGKACSFCGNTDERALEPGADQRAGYASDDWLCSPGHERACVARRERRWPPRPDLVPEAVLSAVGAADEAGAARLARQQIPPAPEQEQESQEDDQDWQQQENLTVQVPTGCVHCGGVGGHLQPHDHYGRYTGHLLSHQPRPHYYRPYGAQSAGEAPGGQGGTSGQGGGEIPPEGVPEGVRQSIEGRWAGGDVQLQQPAHPDALPRQGQAAPAKPRRRGRRLAYSPARPARKPRQDHPGTGGSDSFHGGSDGAGGPSGGLAET